MTTNNEIELIENLISNGVLARPKIPFDKMSLNFQTDILKSKGYEGRYIYQAYSGKVVSITKNKIKVFGNNNQLLETYYL